MRAVACAEAILERFTGNSRVRLLPMWWGPFPGPHGSDISSKGSRSKLSDYYARDRQAYTLTAGLFLVAVFVVFVCMFDAGWDIADDDRSSAFAGFSGSGLRIAHPGRALQSRLEWDLNTRQKTGALHGMGVTFRAGNRAMNELVIAHLAEPTTPEELRLFLRTLHRSGATARADVVLLFPWKLTNEMSVVIDEEERSFQQLMLERQASAPPHATATKKDTTERAGKETDRRQSQSSDVSSEIRAFLPSKSTISPFNAKAFWRAREERKVKGEMILWENATAALYTNGSDEAMASLDWADWGSVVGFEMQDLDQGDVLEGFIQDPPAQLRRWTCYQMLLGMMKNRYRSVLLTEVRGVFILRDVLSPSRKKSFDSGINLYLEDLSWNDVHKARKKRVSSLTNLKAAGHDDSAGGRENLDITGQTALNAEGNSVGEQMEATLDSNSRGERHPRGGGGDATRVRDDPGDSRHDIHFIEEVYGKDVWKTLDQEEKEKKLALGSGFIMGNVRPIRSLSNAMLTEIASLALKRKSRRPFHDKPLLNYLVQKSSVLSRRVTGKLHMLGNRDAPVHSLPGTKQPSVFFRDDGHGFAALLGLTNVPQEQALTIAKSIRDEICSSQADSWAYPDCTPSRE